MKTTKMLAPRWERSKRFSSAAVLFFGFVACGAPANNAALFGGGGGAALSAGSGGSAAELAAAGSAGVGISGASSGGALGEASGGELGAGAAGVSEAGSAGSTLTGSGGNGMSGGAGSGGAPLTDCTAFGPNATYYSVTQHCYLVEHDMATFAAAKAHCSGLGAHLVTLSSQDENDFVWSLDANEHWIGTTDGKGPKENTIGTYSWVTREPFTYTDWSSGQPNASKTPCGDSNGGGDCYEHCGFQWSGGDKAGEWNDRYCFHTIEAVCEWE